MVGSGPSARAPRPLSAQRRWLGVLLTLAGLPLLTAALVPLRDTLSLPSHLLLFLLAVVLIALVGGLWPAVLAAVAAPLLLNWFFTPPYGTLVVAQRDHVLALAVFVAVALAVSLAVELAATSAARATRSEAEAQLVTSLAEATAKEVGLSTILDRLVTTLGLHGARLQERAPSGHWSAVAGSGAAVDARTVTERLVPIPERPTLRLVLIGPPSFAEDRRTLTRFATAAGAALETRRLTDRAAEAERLAAADSLRNALLAAVGHDLRTPLAGVKAAISSLRQTDVRFTAAEQAELHATIEESADQLGRLLANLLDLSRLQAGSVQLSREPVLLDVVVAEALRSIGRPPIRWEIPEDLPAVLADPGLLERVLANLIGNAAQHGVPVAGRSAGRDATIIVRAAAAGPDDVLLQVIDSGPGVAPGDRDRIFAPFQRLDDHGRDSGLGLGLAVARGFVDAMGGRIAASDTPGGGLTLTLHLPAAPAVVAHRTVAP